MPKRRAELAMRSVEDNNIGLVEAEEHPPFAGPRSDRIKRTLKKGVGNLFTSHILDRWSRLFPNDDVISKQTNAYRRRKNGRKVINENKEKKRRQNSTLRNPDRYRTR